MRDAKFVDDTILRDDEHAQECSLRRIQVHVTRVALHYLAQLAHAFRKVPPAITEFGGKARLDHIARRARGIAIQRHQCVSKDRTPCLIFAVARDDARFGWMHGSTFLDGHQKNVPLDIKSNEHTFESSERICARRRLPCELARFLVDCRSTIAIVPVSPSASSATFSSATFSHPASVATATEN